MIDFGLDPELALLRDLARHFAEERLRPRDREHESAREIDAAVRRAFAETGLAAVEWPENLGGAGLGALAGSLVLEELAAADAGAAIALDPLGPAVHALAEAGEAAALRAHAAPLLDREGARAVLVWNGDGAIALEGGRATGVAPWVPADRVDLVVLLDADSVAVVDSDIALTRLRGAGLRAAGASELRLEAAPIRDWWVDPVAARRALARARLHTAALLVGVLRAAAEFSRTYALSRVTFGKPIAHHQALAFLITDMAAAVEGTRLLVHEAAVRLDRGDDATEACATAFVEAVEQSGFVAPNAVQILGGHGFMQDYPVEKWMREARALGLVLGGVDAARQDAGMLLLAGERVNFAIDDALQKRLAGLRELGRTQIRPLGIEADRAGKPVDPGHPFYALLLQLGLGRTRWLGGEPEAKKDRAGAGPAMTGVLLSEELAYWDRGVAVSFPGPGLGEPPLLSMGTPEQKERFLAPFREPDRPRWGSFAMTEPGAGSDVAAIRTSCRRDGDHWILDGDKSFAANASRADWIVVWATVDRSLGRAGHRAFIVERDTPGLSDWKVEKKMGLKAYESTSFTLRGCRVPAANLLGGDDSYARKAGFRGALQSFNATRPMIGAMAVGIGRAALDAATDFAREHALLGDPRVRDRLERIHRKLRVARLFCWRAAWLADEQQPNMVEASMAKAHAPTAALEAASLGMELLGPVGARGDHLVEKLFRDVKAMDIVEGTGQIQRIVMARQLVGLPRDE